MFGHLSQRRDRSHNDSDEDNLEILERVYGMPIDDWNHRCLDRHFWPVIVVLVICELVHWYYVYSVKQHFRDCISNPMNIRII